MASFDPGISGAFALDYGPYQDVFDIPVMQLAKAKIVNPKELYDTLMEDPPDVIVIEKVGAMPKQGLSSTFNFGYTAGVIFGVAASTGARIVFVTPQEWKKHFRLIGQSKEAARAKAILEFPNLSSSLKRKKDSDRGEALLIGRFYREKKLH